MFSIGDRKTVNARRQLGRLQSIRQEKANNAPIWQAGMSLAGFRHEYLGFAAACHRIGPSVANVLFHSRDANDHDATASRVTGWDLEMYSCCRARKSAVSWGL